MPEFPHDIFTDMHVLLKTGEVRKERNGEYGCVGGSQEEEVSHL